MKKKVLFFVYCAVMITGIVLFLIFAPNLLNDDSKIEDNKYANRIQLNCEDDIVLTVGSSVELLDGYLTITPSDCSSQMRTEISSKNSTISGITFKNNIITANSLGTYTIKFLIAKSEYSDASDILTITVVDDDDDTNVEILNNNFTNNTTVNILNIFSFDEMFKNFSVDENEYLTYLSNSVKFTSTGRTEIGLNMFTSYLKFSYKFNILINPQYTACIEISDENNGVLEISAEVGDSFEISYVIVYNSNENESQDISIPSNDSVEILTITSPIITCKCLSKTTSTLTITPSNPYVAPKQLTIVFK